MEKERGRDVLAQHKGDTIDLLKKCIYIIYLFVVVLRKCEAITFKTKNKINHRFYLFKYLFTVIHILFIYNSIF